MTGIQIILLSGFAFLALYFITKLRNHVTDILVFLVLFLPGIIFVLVPEWTNIIAKRLGVGRGADLVFYTCILGFSFVIMMLYSKIRKIDQTITQIIRNKAKKEASKPNDS